jgi:NlpC/P60 family putative phage cell wall peptidase
MEIESRIPSPPMGERGRGEGERPAHAAALIAGHPSLHSHRPLTLYPSPPVGERESQLVQIARSWIGTPYVHQASLKHVGCDCLGLLRGIWRELTGEEPEEAPPYSLDWAEATGAETLYIALKRHAGEVGTERLAPGDIALFRMASRGPAKHCGVVAERGGAPSLIHARQNKRVSEELLSLFWRNKLAFAFRL